MEIIEQRNGVNRYNGQRVYLDFPSLMIAGLTPGKRYRTETEPSKHLISFTADQNGENLVSGKKKKDNIIPIIDKQGQKIREALDDCDRITISIVKENDEYRVIVQGEKVTATIKREQKIFSTQLKSITFCAGSGISSEALKQSNFHEVAAVEWNPPSKEGKEDKFAEMYRANNQESVLFNIPLQYLKAEHLPYADLWLATLDCTDFSKAANGTGKELHTQHLFIHLMRLFWEKPKAERPIAILIENVPEFQKIAGNSLELCLVEEGYHVTQAQIDSLNYGSRTKRKRYFMMASIYEGFSFSFPNATGPNTTPIIEDGTISLEELDWVTPETDGTLQYFLNRQKGKMSHNHKMTTFDITSDFYIGTVTKSHHKKQPENWIRHPYKKDTYAYLKAEQIKALHGIPSHLYLGDSNKLKVEAIGQSVCFTTFKKIAESVYQFLSKSIRPSSNMKKEKEYVEELGQLAFAF